MTKAKNYWYVLVFAEDGPKFVTKIDNASKTAYWNTEETPLPMTRDEATWMSRAFAVNGILAVAVSSFYELSSHMYQYDKGHFEWMKNQ